MPIPPEDVVAAYELILGRPPEHAGIVALHAAAHDSRASLGASLMASGEAQGQLMRFGTTNHVVLGRLGLSAEDLALMDWLAPWTERSAEPGFIVDSLGIRTRAHFVEGGEALSGRLSGLPFPSDFHAEAMEWVALVRALRAAQGRLRMAELGAGWGPWTAAAFVLARRLGVEDVRLHAVEADPALFGWLEQHLADNAIAPEAVRLHQAAIGESPGEVLWPGRAAGAADYGARPMEAAGRDHRGIAVAAAQRVRVLPIAELLEMEPSWDLVHMDLQGLEARLCATAMPLLRERVRHVVVATHSAALDAACFALFQEAGWDGLNHLLPRVTHRRHAASIEAMTELDGTQLWRNPALTP